jgi:hypothetical protein
MLGHTSFAGPWAGGPYPNGMTQSNDVPLSPAQAQPSATLQSYAIASEVISTLSFGLVFAGKAGGRGVGGSSPAPYERVTLLASRYFGSTSTKE